VHAGIGASERGDVNRHDAVVLYYLEIHCGTLSFMTTKVDVLNELGEKWWPMAWQRWFTPQRAPDMWFGDELPPTLQAQVASPYVQQSMWMVQHQVRQTLEHGARQQAALNERRRLTALASRVGKRAKAKRH
jgi:hypothetical protein